MRVAIVEDDVVQSDLLRRLCIAQGASPEVFRLGRQFLRHAATSGFDLAMIDIRLPDLSGIEVLAKLKARESVLSRPMPTMIVTGCADTAVMQSAFDHGAADFVVKPFHGDALMIRARAIARRDQPRLFNDAPIRVAGIQLNLATLQAFVDGREVLLTQKELHIAWLLFRKQGATISRSEIARLVWGRSESSASRTIDTHIGRIRQKLGLDLQPAIRLRPIYGVGYRLDVFS